MLKLGIVTSPKRQRPNYNIVFALNHGINGGGFREGYPLNKLHDIFRWSDADVNLMAHIHQLKVDKKKMLSVDQHSNLKKRYKHLGITGCFLYTYKENNPNYFEAKGRAESDIGMLKVSIKPNPNNPKLELTEIVLG